MEFKVKIDDNTKQIINKLGNEMETILKAVGEKAEGYAKQDCPVDTGRLRNSIAHQEEQNVVYIGSDVEYAPAIEFRDMAHKNGKAHFLRDALQNHLDEYEKLIKDGVEAAIK